MSILLERQGTQAVDRRWLMSGQEMLIVCNGRILVEQLKTHGFKRFGPHPCDTVPVSHGKYENSKITFSKVSCS